jgi:hypothetical protein
MRDARAAVRSAVLLGALAVLAAESARGSVVGWGNNASGQAEGSDGGASAIASGLGHICAIRADDGAVVCWGENGLGEATPPDLVNGTEGGAVAIAAGGTHALAIPCPSSPRRYCWGAASPCSRCSRDGAGAAEQRASRSALPHVALVQLRRRLATLANA